MTDTFFVNQAIVVDQNTAVYGAGDTANASAYEYILSINIGSNTLNDMFDGRNFKQTTDAQNDSNENTYVVNLQVNNTVVSDIFNADRIAISSSYSGISTTSHESGEKQLGLRLLEVMAMKIFGHARARAAISNDTAFYAIRDTVAGKIHDAFNDKRNDIFNQYVAFDRVEENNGNDVSIEKNFNFLNTSFDLPMYLNGSIESSVSVPHDLLNGPNVGGNQLINGLYNVSFLLRFSQSA